MSEFTDDEVVGTTLIENEPGSVVPVVEVKHPGSWREQRDKVFKRARYPKEMKEKILVRMGELFEQGNLKTDILRIMKEEGFKKADGIGSIKGDVLSVFGIPVRVVELTALTINFEVSGHPGDTLFGSSQTRRAVLHCRTMEDRATCTNRAAPSLQLGQDEEQIS